MWPCSPNRVGPCPPPTPGRTNRFRGGLAATITVSQCSLHNLSSILTNRTQVMTQTASRMDQRSTDTQNHLRGGGQADGGKITVADGVVQKIAGMAARE